MKPEEAIEELRKLRPRGGIIPQKRAEMIDFVISALKEIQQYREIGKVKECKAAMYFQKRLKEADNNLYKVLVKCSEYEQIGTVEECRKAVEKQKPQKPKDSLKIKPVIDENGAYVDADTTVYLLCPNCGEMVGIDERIDSFCCECGQAIMQEGDEA